MFEVAYVVSSALIEAVDKLPIVYKRASMVHSLIHNLEIFGNLKTFISKKASEEDIRQFHSEEYVNYLKNSNLGNSEEEDNYGLGFDCPIFCDLFEFSQEVAGSSLTAADILVNDIAKISINWCGGWHHAQRDSASGFCYVNDAVLAIQRLRKKFDRIIYIDLDVHHGDGVENAFLFSKKILTVSLHQQEPGFFPGTGASKDIGLGKGKFHAINIPYKAGINDKQIVYLFESLIYDIFCSFKPDAIVCQCGADALTGDPMASGNLTLEGYLKCVQIVLGFNKPTLFLGGGGYNKVNTSKLWAGITMTALKSKLPEDIPEHPFFTLYGPDFLFDVSASLRKSENSTASLNEAIKSSLSSLILMESTSKDEKEDLATRVEMMNMQA